LDYFDSNLAMDGTLPRSREGINCTAPDCDAHEIVFFTPSDEVMELIFMCRACGHRWDPLAVDEQEAAAAAAAAAAAQQADGDGNGNGMNIAELDE
jgi:hypothetical protein